MPIKVVEGKLGVSQTELERLWQLVREATGRGEEWVMIKGVSPEEIKRLNRIYRHQDEETDVLTFSYGEGSHDVAVCPEVIKEKAPARGMAVKNYTAWVIVHACLHAVGVDHERSDERIKMAAMEQQILKASGFGE